MSLEHTDTDKAIVETQLGRPTRGEWSVARRCHLGVPMVIENYPRLEDGAPFPTLFWLTCPILIKRVSHQEAGGGLARMTELLGADPALEEVQARAVQRYKERRDAHEPISDAGSPPGGDAKRAKCFHALVAHEIADPPNPVGARALNEAGWPDCIAPCYEVES